MARTSRLKVITDEDMSWIHEASLKILQDTGVIYHNDEALLYEFERVWTPQLRTGH